MVAGSSMDRPYGESLTAALQTVSPLAERFADAGYRLYLVGGVVRDDFLERPRDDGDYDLTTDARPEAIRALLDGVADAIWLQGERFGTIGCRLRGREYEITTHRSDTYDHQSRKPEVVFGDEIAVDLSRRDFTVNAMAVDAVTGDLLDPFHGVDDLRQGRLRTPSGPEISFNDDPLRMVRAARFIATLGLVADPDLISAAARLRSRLKIVAVERIREELDKIVVLPDPHPGVAFLAETGLLGELLPELAEAEPTQLGQALRRVEPQTSMRWAALLGDVAGPEAQAVLVRLKPSKRMADEVTWYLRAAQWTQSSDGPQGAADLRRLAVAGPEGHSVEDLLVFASDLHEHPTWLVEQLALLEELQRQEPDFHQPVPALSGGQIADLLGIEPGPSIGDAHRMLADHRFDFGPVGPAEAEQLVREWWARVSQSD